ncbi:rRNA cytosine-C5-methyltransferase [Parabacteroides sp. OttesenSCG-928-N08]|nr:rRNA cytosine-C5-methyltransferase [Parabacteroides sp. OttesenSCG-928-N08]
MKLPFDFISRTQAILGDRFASLEAALLDTPPVSIRINHKKWHHPISFEPIPWCQRGYYLPQRLAFTFDPLFHAGAYYVQEASSMFLEQAVTQYIDHPVVCLDLCAAPGGKSTHLSQLLPEGSLLVSNEVIRSRSHILAENITKWGNPSSIVTNNDPADFARLPHLFDLLLADVPCSGEGMFRKDPESIGEWSSANVELCAARQRRILQDCWETLKPGGLLIYSTCTYNREENEENLHYLVETFGAEPLPVAVDPTWQVTESQQSPYPAYRFFPHKTKGEGFFLALLRKPDDNGGSYSSKKRRNDKGKRELPIPEEAKRYILQPERFHFFRRASQITAFPTDLMPLYQQLQEKLRIVAAGIEIAEEKGKALLPAHGLAMSLSLNRDAFDSLELSWEDAIRFLRKEALTLPEDVAKGFVLLCYHGHPLGFAKQIGNRANNLYPSEWRIRSQQMPTEFIGLEELGRRG